ncbi:hypothetical protein JTB14_025409 [Gonioctena quinquepunctata]|nr:hypothetical protein JTB14_025409 [Gonioctena quinquepunctata]
MESSHTFHNGEDLNAIETFVEEDDSAAETNDSETIRTGEKLNENINIVPETEHILEHVTNLSTTPNTCPIINELPYSQTKENSSTRPAKRKLVNKKQSTIVNARKMTDLKQKKKKEVCANCNLELDSDTEISDEIARSGII